MGTYQKQHELYQTNPFCSPHSRANDAREVLLRITAHHDNPKALGLVAMEMSPVSIQSTLALSNLITIKYL
jgi:hypothetical protein